MGLHSLRPGVPTATATVIPNTSNISTVIPIRISHLVATITNLGISSKPTTLLHMKSSSSNNSRISETYPTWSQTPSPRSSRPSRSCRLSMARVRPSRPRRTYPIRRSMATKAQASRLPVLQLRILQQLPQHRRLATVLSRQKLRQTHRRHPPRRFLAQTACHPLLLPSLQYLP